MKGHTVSATGTVASPPSQVTRTVPVYSPAGASGGTKTSTQIARLSPAGTLNGKAFRRSFASSSTSGTSASGQGPVAPSRAEAVWTWMSAAR